MKAADLLKSAAQHLEHYNVPPVAAYRLRFFTPGGLWMQDRLRELDVQYQPPARQPQYSKYGRLKYFLSLVASLPGILLAFKFGVLWIWTIVLLFYAAEVHFLFLFPILAAGAKEPLTDSICLTYRIGFLHSLYGVLVIAMYMLAGLARIKKPLKNWHTGCMAVVLWYYYETAGNRIQSPV